MNEIWHCQAVGLLYQQPCVSQSWSGHDLITANFTGLGIKFRNVLILKSLSDEDGYDGFVKRAERETNACFLISTHSFACIDCLFMVVSLSHNMFMS